MTEDLFVSKELVSKINELEKEDKRNKLEIELLKKENYDLRKYQEKQAEKVILLNRKLEDIFLVNENLSKHNKNNQILFNKLFSIAKIKLNNSDKKEITIVDVSNLFEEVN